MKWPSSAQIQFVTKCWHPFETHNQRKTIHSKQECCVQSSTSVRLCLGFYCKNRFFPKLWSFQFNCLTCFTVHFKIYGLYFWEMFSISWAHQNQTPDYKCVFLLQGGGCWISQEGLSRSGVFDGSWHWALCWPGSCATSVYGREWSPRERFATV